MINEIEIASFIYLQSILATCNNEIRNRIIVEITEDELKRIKHSLFIFGDSPQQLNTIGTIVGIKFRVVNKILCDKAEVQ